MPEIASTRGGMVEGSWPKGNGETVDLMISLDWSSTPLGRSQDWPQSRKTAVDLLLTSGFPTIALWGPELIQIYNDGYRNLMGIKHPAGFGQPTRDCWPEVWHINAPIYERVQAGETVTLEDALYPITRSGQMQDAWFNLSYSPLRDEMGLIAGILIVLFETTAQHLAEDRRKFAEASLSESEARHRLLVESWAQAVWEAGANGVVTEDSPSWRAYTGQTLQDWLGYGWLNAIHPDDRTYAERQWREAIAARGFFNAEFRLHAPDGDWRWTNVRAAPVLDTKGQIEKWVGMNIDIDARKRVEAARYESENRLQSVLDSMAEGFALLGPDFTIREVNDEATQLSHQSRAQLVGQSHWDAFPSSEQASIGELLRRAMRDRISGSLEHYYVWPDGRASWLDARAYPTAEGGVAIFWRDVTDRKRIEAALREREERLLLALDAAEMGSFVWYPKDGQGELDDRMLALLDLESARDLHSALSPLLHPDDRNRYAAAVERALDPQGDGSLREEIRVTRPDGGERWLAITGQARLGTGRPRVTRMTGIGRDITARKLDEAVLRESEERFRALFEAMDEAYAVVEVLRDETGAWSDFRFLEANPAFVIHTTMPHPVGKTATELLGAPNPRWAQMYGQVLDTGISVRVQEAEPTLQRIFDLNIFSLDRERNRVAVLFTDVTDRLRSEQILLESEERLRQFGEASQNVLWIRDAETLQWNYLTPAFETIYGLSREAALSGDNFHNWQALIIPEDRDHAVAGIARVAAGEQATFEYRILRPSDGEVRWLRDTDFPIYDQSGRVARIGGIGQDITALKATEAALAEADQRQRLLLEGIPQLVWRAVSSGHWTWASPQWTRYTGQPEVRSHGWGWLEPLHPDDREAAVLAWSRAEQTGGFEVEYRIRRAGAQSAKYHWFQTRATPVRDTAGGIAEWLGTSTDIHDLRVLQEHQRVLVAELQHRTRNLIAVVRSTADKTARNSASLTDFREAFRDRLNALARVQGLLSRLEEHDRVTFDELIGAEIAALDGSATRVTLEGPSSVRLRSSMVQTLAMALHELATNAMKYGALAQPQAQLKVSWSLREDRPGGEPWLRIEWCESDVHMPPLQATPAGTGQGRLLIERALPYQLGARTTYRIGQDGVRCTIEIPISRSPAELDESHEE